MAHCRQFYFLFFILLFLSAADRITAQADDALKLSIGSHKVSESDYLTFIMETDPDNRLSEEDLTRRFLTYHLKVYDARSRGFDTMQQHVASVAELRQLLAIEKTDFDYLGDSMVMRYFERTRWEIALSHIRIDIEGSMHSDTLDEYVFVDSIRHLADSETKFKALAYAFSDSRTAADSGYIGVLTGMQAPFPLEEMAFNTDVGSVSEIYRTSGSYHLVFVHSKTMSADPPGTSREMENEVRNHYQHDQTRLNYLRDKYLRNVLAFYGFRFFEDAYEEFVMFGASAFNEGKWVAPELKGNEKALFQIGNRTATFSDFSGYLSEQAFAYRIVNYRPVINSHFQDFMFQVTKAYDQAHIGQRFPDVQRTLDRFSNGLLIQMIDSELAREAALDVKGLKRHFRKNKEQYKVQGYSGLVIWFSDVQSRMKLEFEIRNMDAGPDSLERILGNYPGIEKTERVEVKKGMNPVIDHFIWKQSPFLPGYSLVIISGDFTELPASDYKEVFAQVVYDHSGEMEADYIRQLKKKHTVKIY